MKLYRVAKCKKSPDGKCEEVGEERTAWKKGCVSRNGVKGEIVYVKIRYECVFCHRIHSEINSKWFPAQIVEKQK